MKPDLNVNISAGTIASMSTEQFTALRDNICAEGKWETVTDPIHVSGTGDYIGVNLPGIFIGIEKDGYTHPDTSRQMITKTSTSICLPAHYNALAKEIRKLFPAQEPERPNSAAGRKLKELNMTERGILCALALNLAKRFQEDNPRFDPIKFLEACSPNNDLYPLTELWEGDQLG